MEETETVIKKFHDDGKVEEGEWQMTLAEMQAFVGGYIEYVASKLPGHFLYVNEEGTLDNLPLNYKATELVMPGTNMLLGALQGPALLVKEENE